MVAASILAVLLHAGPVLWVELRQGSSPLDASAPALTHSVEQINVDTNAETRNANAARSTGAD